MAVQAVTMVSYAHLTPLVPHNDLIVNEVRLPHI